MAMVLSNNCLMVMTFPFVGPLWASDQPEPILHRLLRRVAGRRRRNMLHRHFPAIELQCDFALGLEAEGVRARLTAPAFDDGGQIALHGFARGSGETDKG